MKVFDPHKRQQNIHWSLLQIKTLLSTANKNKSSSFIIYAALEGRHILERVEYEILYMASHKSMNIEWHELIEEYKGIQKVNAKYKALKYRYQTFTEALSNVALNDFSLKPFEFKKAEEFQMKLSQYIHTYTRTPEDISFESEFMRAGISLINDTISFVENMFTIHDSDYVFGILDFNSMKNGIEIEFEKWLKSVDENIESLTERLRVIKNNIKE